MKAVNIYPEDIGASGYWSEDWMRFIKKLGWDEKESIWQCVLICNILIND